MDKQNSKANDLLRSLYNKRRIGGRHTEERNVLKRIKHLPREEQDTIIEQWENYKKQELILWKKSTGEIHVSLNPRKLSEINKLIEEKNESNE